MFVIHVSKDPAGVIIGFQSNPGPASSDITFEPEMPFETNYTRATYQCGEINVLEDTRYPQTPTVCVVASTVRHHYR